MTKKFDNFIAYFILLFPFIDFFTGMFSWQNQSGTIGVLIKGIFLLITVFYLLKNYKNKKIFLLMGIYFVGYFIYLLTSDLNLKTEIINCVKIFYLPILILFFSNYENPKITKKTMLYILFFYLLLYLIPYIFGLGHNISEVYPNKDLYLSYFTIGNELVNVLIVLLPVAILYLIESNNYLLKILFTFLLLVTIILLGTKAFYLSIIIIIFYFIIRYRKKVFLVVKKNKIKTLIILIVFGTSLIYIIPKTTLFANIKTSLNHSEVDSVGELFTIENIDHVIFSYRLTFLENVHEKAYMEGNTLEKLFGIGRDKLITYKDVEIDVFDIFYSIGIVGFIFYIGSFIFVLKQTKLKSIYKFSIILIIIISCFSGHVLLSPMVSSYIAILFLVSKNDKGIEKKDCLLVSNMYPSSKYPHYGIFVQNVCDLLIKNKMIVDKVVLFKTNRKLKKIFSYLKFYSISFWKVLWNNYDYIYVHFISHSTRGIMIPYLCSKKTKLILNVHGNDIIADYDFEEKNEKRSKKYLKHAFKVISPSDYFKRILIDKYFVSSNKIIVYPSGGVDHNKFKKIDRKKALNNLSLDEKTTYFGFVSRIEKDKGYDTLIMAINELKKTKKLDNIKFIIVGSGSEENVLNDLIKKYKLSNYIIRKPLVSQEELVNIYNVIKALIYPTRRKSESLGLTGLEAMACETLVIGTNKFGPSDYLINNENSITFDPKDYKMLAEKIKIVLKMTEKEKQRLIKKAKEKSEEYSFKRNQKVILKVFKN